MVLYDYRDAATHPYCHAWEDVHGVDGGDNAGVEHGLKKKIAV